MKFRFAPWLITMLLLGGLLFSGISEASGGIKWYDYRTGIELGRKENKKVYLHFYADWCESCRKMEKETFTDSAVIAYLNKNFVSIKVNADKNHGLVSEYNVRGLPGNWFITEKNEVIGNQPGYLPPDTLLPLLRYVYTDSYLKMSYSKFLEKK